MPVITYSIEMYTHFRSKRLLEDTIRTHTQITEAICARDPQKHTMQCTSMWRRIRTVSIWQSRLLWKTDKTMLLKL